VKKASISNQINKRKYAKGEDAEKLNLRKKLFAKREDKAKTNEPETPRGFFRKIPLKVKLVSELDLEIQKI
jgi:hypothetical protein